MWHKVSYAYVRYDVMRCARECLKTQNAVVTKHTHYSTMIWWYFLLFLSFLSSSCFIFVNCFDWHVIPFRKNEFRRFGSFCFFLLFIYIINHGFVVVAHFFCHLSHNIWMNHFFLHVPTFNFILSPLSFPFIFKIYTQKSIQNFSSASSNIYLMLVFFQPMTNQHCSLNSFKRIL